MGGGSGFDGEERGEGDAGGGGDGMGEFLLGLRFWGGGVGVLKACRDFRITGRTDYVLYWRDVTRAGSSGI